MLAALREVCLRVRVRCVSTIHRWRKRLGAPRKRSLNKHLRVVVAHEMLIDARHDERRRLRVSSSEVRRVRDHLRAVHRRVAAH